MPPAHSDRRNASEHQLSADHNMFPGRFRVAEAFIVKSSLHGLGKAIIYPDRRASESVLSNSRSGKLPTRGAGSRAMSGDTGQVIKLAAEKPVMWFYQPLLFRIGPIFLLNSRAVGVLRRDDQHALEEPPLQRRRGSVELLPADVGIALHDLRRDVADPGADSGVG